jgi:HEAT repeat protein
MDAPGAFAARDSLLASASSSVQCRRKILTALIAAMQQSPVGAAAEDRKYTLFHNAERVLAQLKATEAVDVLMANLTLTDGMSISIGHFPAVLALIDIGQPAIPKLEVVLNKDPEWSRRKFAAFCIASIGGTRARRSLATALPAEKDACVSEFLRSSLRLLNDPRHPNHIVPGNAAFLGPFYCFHD